MLGLGQVRQESENAGFRIGEVGDSENVGFRTGEVGDSENVGFRTGEVGDSENVGFRTGEVGDSENVGFRIERSLKQPSTIIIILRKKESARTFNIKGVYYLVNLSQ